MIGRPLTVTDGCTTLRTWLRPGQWNELQLLRRLICLPTRASSGEEIELQAGTLAEPGYKNTDSDAILCVRKSPQVTKRRLCPSLMDPVLASLGTPLLCFFGGRPCSRTPLQAGRGASGSCAAGRGSSGRAGGRGRGPEVQHNDGDVVVDLPPGLPRGHVLQLLEAHVWHATGQPAHQQDQHR